MNIEKKDKDGYRLHILIDLIDNKKEEVLEDSICPVF